jgi:hypothetical protein
MTDPPFVLCRTLRMNLGTREVRLQVARDTTSAWPVLIELPVAPLRFRSLQELREALGPDGMLSTMSPGLRELIADMVAELDGQGR